MGEEAMAANPIVVPEQPPIQLWPHFPCRPLPVHHCSEHLSPTSCHLDAQPGNLWQSGLVVLLWQQAVGGERLLRAPRKAPVRGGIPEDGADRYLVLHHVICVISSSIMECGNDSCSGS